MSMRFVVDPDAPASPFPHYWEECVGSCHASTALRADWREQVKKARDELGFRSVRFHGLFDDDMSVLVEDRPFGPSAAAIRRPCFLNVDRVYDFLLDIGMKPFVELGFMPRALASGSQECFHYRANVTPPKDYGAWAQLVGAFVEHLEARYGTAELRSWRFEVWNEPNLSFFWGGTREEYFKLYETTARAIKAVDPALTVGGPATSMNAWVPELVAFCEERRVPLDFVSTHHYPTDDPLWRGEITLEQLMALGASAAEAKGEGSAPPVLKYGRGVLAEMARKTAAQAGGRPLLYTEWSCSAMATEPLHDEAYQAAFVAKTLADNSGLVEAYSFWCVSDIFEEGGQRASPFHGGFGLQNVYGTPKPAYRAFELMHALGDARLPVEASGGGPAPTAELLATRRADGSLGLIAYNHQVPGEAVATAEVEVLVLGAAPRLARLSRIDGDHANPKARWIELGSPEYPSRAELASIEEASRLSPVPLAGEVAEGGVLFRISLPPQGLASLDLKPRA